MRTYLVIIGFALFIGAVSSRSLYSNSEDDDTNDLINQDGDNSNDDKSELPNPVQQSIDRISNGLNWKDNNVDDRESSQEDDNVPSLPDETNGIDVSRIANEQYNRPAGGNSDDDDDDNSKDNFDDVE